MRGSVRVVRGCGARRVVAVALCAACAFALLGAAPASSGGPIATLSRRLLANGRGEAEIELRVSDPVGGGRVSRGRLALEPPDRAAIEFPATGERVTLRADGGEWLQPALGQMMVLGSRHAMGANEWWRAFLSRAPGSIASVPLGGRRWLLVRAAGDEAVADSAWVEVDARGLPARLELKDGAGSSTVYRLSAWRFARPRGRAAFVIRPPAGTRVVALP
jgi:hypothetical protein